MSSALDDTDLPLASGAIAGVAAWLVGYILTYAVTSGSIRNSLIGQFLQNSNGGSVWQAVGLVFYNAHFVNTIVNAGFFGSSSTNFIGGDNGFTTALYGVPVILLLLAGLVVAYQTDVRDPAGGATAGVTVTIGYFVLSLIGVFVMKMGSGNPSAGPDVVTGIVLAGVIYPVVLGAVGGAIGGFVSE